MCASRRRAADLPAAWVLLVVLLAAAPTLSTATARQLQQQTSAKAKAEAGELCWVPCCPPAVASSFSVRSFCRSCTLNLTGDACRRQLLALAATDPRLSAALPGYPTGQAVHLQGAAHVWQMRGQLDGEGRLLRCHLREVRPSQPPQWAHCFKQRRQPWQPGRGQGGSQPGRDSTHHFSDQSWHGQLGGTGCELRLSPKALLQGRL